MTDNEKQQIRKEILIAQRAQLVSEMSELYRKIAECIRLTDKDIANGELTNYTKNYTCHTLAELEMYPEMRDMFPDEIQHLDDNLEKGDKQEQKNRKWF